MLLAEISDLENERQHHDEDESQRKKQPAAPVGEFIKGFGASLIDSGQYLRPVVDDRVERGRIERVDLGPRKYELAAGLVQCQLLIADPRRFGLPRELHVTRPPPPEEFPATFESLPLFP